MLLSVASVIILTAIILCCIRKIRRYIRRLINMHWDEFINRANHNSNNSNVENPQASNIIQPNPINSSTVNRGREIRSYSFSYKDKEGKDDSNSVNQDNEIVGAHHTQESDNIECDEVEERDEVEAIGAAAALPQEHCETFNLRETKSEEANEKKKGIKTLKTLSSSKIQCSTPRKSYCLRSKSKANEGGDLNTSHTSQTSTTSSILFNQLAEKRYYET